MLIPNFSILPLLCIVELIGSSLLKIMITSPFMTGMILVNASLIYMKIFFPLIMILFFIITLITFSLLSSLIRPMKRFAPFLLTLKLKTLSSPLLLTRVLDLMVFLLFFTNPFGKLLEMPSLLLFRISIKMIFCSNL